MRSEDELGIVGKYDIQFILLFFVVLVDLVVVEYYCFLIINIAGATNLLDTVSPWNYKHFCKSNSNTTSV